jgi:hypothetical protein
MTLVYFGTEPSLSTRPPESQRLNGLERGLFERIGDTVHIVATTGEESGTERLHEIAQEQSGLRGKIVDHPFLGPGGKCLVQTGIVPDKKGVDQRFIRMPYESLSDELLIKGGLSVAAIEIWSSSPGDWPRVFVEIYKNKQGIDTMLLEEFGSRKKKSLEEAVSALDKVVESHGKQQEQPRFAKLMNGVHWLMGRTLRPSD